jgi:DNA-binding MarR family transcriptional regulator
MSASNPQNDALEPIANLDRLIHEPARLMIMAFLYVVDSADFIFTMNQTGLTRGNLSTHMTKLEEAGYLEVKKEFVEKRPLTMLQLTDKGREAFQDYRDSIQEVMGSLPK